jgi:hypothetical protein
LYIPSSAEILESTKAGGVGSGASSTGEAPSIEQGDEEKVDSFVKRLV